MGYEGEFVGSEFITKNHKGATDFSKEIEKYLRKEVSYGAIIGPFFKNPFCCDFKSSPLNTVIKKDSVERRVILDLSYPVGNSINDGIFQEYYLGKNINVCYPNVDDLVDIIKLKGQGCLMFKKDFKRAYRQIPLCPGDMHLVGFQWEDAIFADRVLFMGLRSSSQICQRVTSAVVFMYFNMGFMAVNYLDDFGGAEVPDRAIEAYIEL